MCLLSYLRREFARTIIIQPLDWPFDKEERSRQFVEKMKPWKKSNIIKSDALAWLELLFYILNIIKNQAKMAVDVVFGLKSHYIHCEVQTKKRTSKAECKTMCTIIKVNEKCVLIGRFSCSWCCWCVVFCVFGAIIIFQNEFHFILFKLSELSHWQRDIALGGLNRTENK